MAELRQTYCSCYTAVRSSKKSSSRILDFITKLSANRLQPASADGRNDPADWQQGGARSHREFGTFAGQTSFETFDQPQRSSSSDLVNSHRRPKAYLLFTCPRTSVGAHRRPYFSGSQCKQDIASSLAAVPASPAAAATSQQLLNAHSPVVAAHHEKTRARQDS